MIAIHGKPYNEGNPAKWDYAIYFALGALIAMVVKALLYTATKLYPTKYLLCTSHNTKGLDSQFKSAFINE